MSNQRIIKAPTSSKCWIDIFNRHEYRGFFFKDGEFDFYLCMRPEGINGYSMKIANVNHALKRGKECQFYTLTAENSNEIFDLLKYFEYDSKRIISSCDALDFEAKFTNVHINEVKVSLNSRKGVDVFSPFALERLNPLKEVPKKWRISHVIRMLANSQFENLMTDHRDGDDSGKKEADRDDLLIKLIERPGGWWMNGGQKDGDKLGINHCSFDYKSCVINLKGNLKSNDGAEALDSVKEPTLDLSSITPPKTVQRAAGILML